MGKINSHEDMIRAYRTQYQNGKHDENERILALLDEEIDHYEPYPCEPR